MLCRLLLQMTRDDADADREETGESIQPGEKYSYSTVTAQLTTGTVEGFMTMS